MDTSPTDSSAIDLATFAELREAVGDEFAAELVDTFLDEAPGILADLRSALTADDADAYRRAAHTLKSNGQTFGAIAFAALARQAELGGITGDRARDVAALDALDDTYAAAAAELKELSRG